MTHGDIFRLLERPGQRYKFLEILPNGTIRAYGGDKSPLGRQQYEHFSKDSKLIQVNETTSERHRREAQENQRRTIR